MPAYRTAGGTYSNPVNWANTPDPGVMWDPATKQYVAATTSGDDAQHFPIWTSPDLATWTAAGYAFAPSGAPAWAVSDYWAPEIHIVNGEYTLYFTARDANGVLCIGVAKSTTGKVTGPYVDPLGKPLVQRPSRPGTIDATYFQDPLTGNGYVIWKLDGNDVGEQTPIYAARVSPNGTVFTSAPTQLITNDQPWEGVLTEGPWMVAKGSAYYLFYSGGSEPASGGAKRGGTFCAGPVRCPCAGNEMGAYAVGVAQSASPLGPFTKLPNPILHTNTTLSQPPFVGPGHCSVLAVQDGSGGTAIVYHAWQWAPNINFGLPRYMMLDAVQWVPASGGGGLVWPQLVASGGVPSNRSMPVP